MHSIDLLHVCRFQGSNCGIQKILGILGQKISKTANDSNSSTDFISESSPSERSSEEKEEDILES
jgi:hypothetical protein